MTNYENLSTLIKDEIFYKLIVFESLDSDKFMQYINHHGFETLNGIYINIDFYDDEETKIGDLELLKKKVFLIKKNTI